MLGSGAAGCRPNTRSKADVGSKHWFRRYRLARRRCLRSRRAVDYVQQYPPKCSIPSPLSFRKESPVSSPITVTELGSSAKTSSRRVAVAESLLSPISTLLREYPADTGASHNDTGGSARSCLLADPSSLFGRRNLDEWPLFRGRRSPLLLNPTPTYGVPGIP